MNGNGAVPVTSARFPHRHHTINGYEITGTKLLAGFAIRVVDTAGRALSYGEVDVFDRRQIFGLDLRRGLSFCFGLNFGFDHSRGSSWC